jgi:hypothetical protein
VRFEVLTAVKMSMLFFQIVTPCGFISEKHIVSIFRAAVINAHALKVQNKET